MATAARDKTVFPVNTLTVSYYLLKITMHIAQCGVKNDFFTDQVRRLICSKINNFPSHFFSYFRFKLTTEFWWIHTATCCLGIDIESIFLSKGIESSSRWWSYWRKSMGCFFLMNILKLKIMLAYDTWQTKRILDNQMIGP